MPDTPPRRKKLIEVALPLEAINAASAREKSIRHGHPSTLHLWWARRPLAACRAVLFAQLVDDPSSDPAFRNADGTVDEERAGVRRAELFDLIEELVKWENSNNTKVINAARAEIAASVASRKVELGELQKDTVVFGKDEGKPHPDGPMADDGTTAWRVMLRRSKPEVVNHFLATYAPPVLDPFAGGGSIPLEAQRLGLRAQASDLNPVPVLINKALIEIPPKFVDQPPVHPDAEKKTGWSGATGLAEDVKCFGLEVQDKAQTKIGSLYPTITVTEEMTSSRDDLCPLIGKELTVLAWLWARTVPSNDPAAAGCPVPLVRSFWLSRKRGGEAWVRPTIDREHSRYSFEVKTGPKPQDFDPGDGTVERTGGRCLLTGSPLPFDHIRSEAKAGRMRARLLAIVCQDGRQRVYLPPTADHEQVALTHVASGAPETDLPDQALGFRVQLYGMTRHSDLFTQRQLELLSTVADLAAASRDWIKAACIASGRSDCDEYANAVSTYLAEASSKLSAFHCTLASWRSKEGKSARAFGRQNLAMNWDYAEVNPFAKAGGSFHELFEAAWKTIANLPASASGSVVQRNATDIPHDLNAVISTDPPYYDNVGYADLSDFYYVWLRRSCAGIYPDLFSTMLTPKVEELIATPHRHGGSYKKANQFFESGLKTVVSRLRDVTVDDAPVTIYYAFKQAESDGDTGQVASTGWETFLAGLIAAGMHICGTWPVRTESTVGLKNLDNVLASSIVLVCRARPEGEPLATRREFSDTLRRELPEAIRHLQSGNVAPVDLAQASIGPGIGVFSRYSKVVNADGSQMSVREALQLINQVLDEALSEQEGDFDSETRFALKWFEQYGMKDGVFGEAEVLATAMAVSVQGVVEAGVAVSRAGRVRLLSTDELDPAWDPQTDDRLTIWEVTHHLIRELEQNGESAAADLLRRVGSGAGQTARELAYRLYQTCERKKWADWARSYNGLVVSWPEIERLSRDKRAEPATTDAGLFASE